MLQNFFPAEILIFRILKNVLNLEKQVHLIFADFVNVAETMISKTNGSV